MSLLANDQNASSVNTELLEYLKIYDNWSCCIFRDIKTSLQLTADLALSEIRISANLIPQAGNNIEALVLLNTVSVTSKSILANLSVAGRTPFVPDWTVDDLEKEKEELLDTRRLYEASKAAASNDGDQK